MAFRNLRVAHLHSWRDAGVAAITSQNAVDAAFPVDFLIDDQSSIPMKFATSEIDHALICDLGAGFPTGLSRLLIPAGNVVGTAIQVFEDDHVGFTSATALSTATVVTSGNLIDIDFNLQTSTEQFIRVGFVGTGIFEIPEMFVTKTVSFDSPAAGPKLERALDQHHLNFLSFEQTSGRRPTLQKGARQRELRFDWDAPLTGSDLTAMKAFLADVEMHRPFFVDPPSTSTPPETDEPARYMRMLQEPQSNWASVNPVGSGQERRTFILNFIDNLD